MHLDYVSVDVETSGPSPSRHSLLAIGACLVADPERTFYVELRPDGTAAEPDAVAVSGLSLDRLTAEGIEPGEAMRRFAQWVETVVTSPRRPVLVALNAPFDWMFVADYFHRYLGRNPFGHSALDVKALFMGVTGAPWEATSLPQMAARYEMGADLPHHALHDAIIQAAVFRRILAEHERRAIE